jgi:RNA polymerase sigma-70 factor (ECF subfamily)
MSATISDLAGADALVIDHLVRAAQHGDPAAFDRLVDVYGSRVFRYVRTRIPESDVEDVTQRIFVQVIEGLPRYVDRGLPFASWLFRIARNVVIDAARARREYLSLEAAELHASGRPGPSEILEAAQGRQALAEALASLNQDQRDVILARFFADLTTRETAALLQRNEASVRVLQFRALQNLRRRLAPRYGRAIDRLGLEEARP